MKTNRPSFIRSLIFALVLGGIMFFYFNNKKSEPRGIASQVESTEVVVASTSVGTIEGDQKLNHYIACMNRQSERAYDSYNRYLSWVDKKTGPTGNEKLIYGLYTLYDLESCEVGNRNAAGMQPSMPELEALAGSFLSALSTLHVVIEEADRYYDHKDYLDDKMAKGKALHIKLMDAFAAFMEIDQKLRKQINREKSVADKRQTQDWEQQGKKAELLAMETMETSSEIVQMTWNKSLESIDLESLSKSTDLLEEKTTALETLSQTANIRWSVNTYLDKCQRMLKAAKALKRRVRDKTPYNRSEEVRLKNSASWTVEGSPFQLRRTFNDLVRVFNQLELAPKPVQMFFIPDYEPEAVDL